MWFEVLPPAMIILGCLCVPQFVPGFINYAVRKNAYRRNLNQEENHLQYMRDIRLAGDPYIVKGLESIPDQ